MQVYQSVSEIRAGLRALHQSDQRLGFVPTMGALHAGHLTLAQAAKAECQHVVVSIFVNPTQFGPNEDFAQYPRTLEADLQLLRSMGITAAWIPSPADIYPLGEAGIQMQVGPIASWLCGQSRPHHFHGVAQVVAKLFNAVRPTHAYFGEKDWQQTRVIAQLVRDYLYPLELVVCPTLREADGLALSSRNRYLSPEARAIAPQLYQMLQSLAAQAQAGQSATTLRELGFRLLAQEPAWQLDYLEIRHEDDLRPVDTLEAGQPYRALVAAYLGQTRLIDNLRIVPF